MSASLVGSEMCIRDSSYTLAAFEPSIELFLDERTSRSPAFARGRTRSGAPPGVLAYLALPS
eukprot:9802540-Alexandrium_andersonii.AAC.1